MKAVIALPDGTTITLVSRRSSTKGRRKAKGTKRYTYQSRTPDQKVKQLAFPW